MIFFSDLKKPCEVQTTHLKWGKEIYQDLQKVYQETNRTDEPKVLTQSSQ